MIALSLVSNVYKLCADEQTRVALVGSQRLSHDTSNLFRLVDVTCPLSAHGHADITKR